MNIPTIEELTKIGHEAAIGVANPDRQRRQQAFASAIRAVPNIHVVRVETAIYAR
jgi:hypothetical protein